MDRRSWVSLSSGLAVALLFVVSEHRGIHWISGSDWTVIAVLSLFLISTEGLRESGYLQWFIRSAADREITNGPLFGTLAICSAALAAIATNDVSLFVVVPLTVGICIKRRISAGPLVVIEAMAANVGSAAMPWGNPQNIFLFHRYALAPGAFYRLLLPPTVIMLAFLAAGAAWIGSKEQVRRPFVGLNEGCGTPTREAEEEPPDHLTGMSFSALLVVSTLQVLHLIPASAEFLVLTAVAVAIAVRPRTLFQADWTLILLFAVIFVAIHALEQSTFMTVLGRAFGGRSSIRIFLAAVGASQLVSNVPAALIGAGAGHSWIASHRGAPGSQLAALLIGVNVGGLGTPVASIANLIAARLFHRSGGPAGEFYSSYFWWNAAGLALYALLGYGALRWSG